MQQLWKKLAGATALSAAAIGMTLVFTPASAQDAMQETSSPVIATNTTEITPEVASGWYKEDNGDIFYYDKNGSKLTGAQVIEDIPYLFAEDGTLKTGWQTINGMRYYYDPENGTAVVGWLTYQGERYYITNDTGKQIGWLTLDVDGTETHYFLDANGVLQTGFFQADTTGSLYYADDTGAVFQDGIYVINNTPYWFYDDGTLHTGWQTIDGIRRYYDPQTGQAAYGWVIWNQQYYYVTAESGKYTGLQKVDGTYYPFSETDGAIEEGFCTLPDGTVRYYYTNGSWQKGWLYDADGSRYYFSDDGSMQIGWQTISNSIYYFAADGKMAVGFTKIDGDSYYFAADGTQQFGLKKIDDKWYMLNTDTGAVEHGWISLENGTYYFQADGSAAIGWYNLNGNRYYFAADGRRCSGWQTIAGKRYCFNGNGVMVTGWQTAADGSSYYFGTDGAMLTGWNQISGNTYYFTSSGTNVRGLNTISGTKYYFDPSSGILLRSQTKNGVTTDANGVVTKLVLSVPYLSQSGFPTGCESASAVMLLQAAGYSTSIATFVDTALDIGYLSYSGGTLYGPDPNQAFVGDPRSSHGYGCYVPVIVNALNRILSNGDAAKNVSGTPISQLLTEYIDKGTPVAIWATINMMAPESGTQWVVSGTGNLFTWIKHEHCLVLVGYDSQYYYMNDPYNSNGLRAYSRAVVEARYAALGYQAVVIQS